MVAIYIYIYIYIYILALGKIIELAYLGDGSLEFFFYLAVNCSAAICYKAMKSWIIPLTSFSDIVGKCDRIRGITFPGILCEWHAHSCPLLTKMPNQ